MLVIGCGLLACSEEAHPPIVFEGEHISFGTDADPATICGGTLPYADEFAGYLKGVFGRPEVHVEYYWYPVGAVPHCRGSGCAVEDRVYSRHALHQHEIAHAVRRLAYTPLEEGIAELYGDDWRWSEDPVAFDVPGFLREHADPETPYSWRLPATMSHFVSYLRAEYGTDTLMALDEVSRRDHDYARTVDLFHVVYGIALNEILDEYEADYPVCDKTFYRDDGFDCGRNVVALPAADGGELTLDVALGCDDPGVVGPRLGTRWTTLSLDVPVAAAYLVGVELRRGGDPETASATGAEARIRRCGSSCFDKPMSVTESALDLFGEAFCLDAGRYTLRLAVGEQEHPDTTYHVYFENAGPGQCT